MIYRLLVDVPDLYNKSIGELLHNKWETSQPTGTLETEVKLPNRITCTDSLENCIASIGMDKIKNILDKVHSTYLNKELLDFNDIEDITPVKCLLLEFDENIYLNRKTYKCSSEVALIVDNAYITNESWILEDCYASSVQKIEIRSIDIESYHSEYVLDLPITIELFSIKDEEDRFNRYIKEIEKLKQQKIIKVVKFSNKIDIRYQEKSIQEEYIINKLLKPKTEVFKGAISFGYS